MPSMSIMGFLYLFVLVLDILAIVLHRDEWRWVTKPLLMILLFVLFLRKAKPVVKGDWMIISALIMALFGDVFLLFEGSKFFLFGMGSFFIMQVLYATRFFQQKAIGVHRFLVPLIIIIAGSVAFEKYLIPHLPDTMKIPIVLYSVSIITMLVAAMLRWRTKGYWLVLIGAVLFTFSDALIALERFVTQEDWMPVAIMLTYGLAQFSIVQGYTASRHLLS